MTQRKLAYSRVCFNKIVIVELPQLFFELDPRIDYRSNTTITISFKKWDQTMRGTIPPTGLVNILMSRITMLGSYKCKHQTQKIQALTFLCFCYECISIYTRSTEGNCQAIFFAFRAYFP